jgi:hypothetical protein
LTEKQGKKVDGEESRRRKRTGEGWWRRRAEGSRLKGRQGERRAEQVRPLREKGGKFVGLQLSVHAVCD